MNITIVGAGNIGTQFAVHCAAAGHAVTVYTSRPGEVGPHLSIVNSSKDPVLEADIALATSQEKEAFEKADVIFVTVPAFAMETLAQKIEPWARPGLKIGLIPGTGGGEFAFCGCLEKGAVVFGLQRVPSVARLVEYGKSVCATGYRKQLHAAALPQRAAAECAALLESLFHQPCACLPNYLSLTLTPSNPILHTTRLRVLFGDYKPGRVYESVPLFYEEWDDATSRLLFACDQELQQVCACLKPLDLSQVKSLKVHYESDSPEKLTAKIRSIEGFKGLPSPALRVSQGWIPDWKSRYFTSDFPWGLSILVQIADLTGTPVPNMKEVLDWYTRTTKDEGGFQLKKWNIQSLEGLLSFYQRESEIF